MSDNLPAHLNEVLDTMSREMGVPRDALVSQAVYQLARLNGYVVPGKISGGAAPAAAVPISAKTMQPTPAAKPAPAPAAAPAGLKKRAPEPEPEPEEEPPSEDEEGNPFDEQVQDAPPEDEQPEEEPPPEDQQEEEPPPEEEPPQEEEEPEPAPPPAKSKGPTMIISMAGREPYKMTGDQVLLGRGKHCDFVIESNRVSREHARFTRKGNDFFVEDLGSSNGSFVGAGSKEKLTAPKKLKDGDDVTFGTEKVKVAIKK
jgi:hypothetical protein